MSCQTQPPALTLSDPWKFNDNIIRPYLLGSENIVYNSSWTYNCMSERPIYQDAGTNETLTAKHICGVKPGDLTFEWLLKYETQYD